MDFQVKRNEQYKELIIQEGGGTLETGLLKRGEALSLAINLLSAAEDLSNYSTATEIEDIRSELRKELGSEQS